jgi:hypothetical protein
MSYTVTKLHTSVKEFFPRGGATIVEVSPLLSSFLFLCVFAYFTSYISSVMF